MGSYADLMDIHDEEEARWAYLSQQETREIEAHFAREQYREKCQSGDIMALYCESLEELRWWNYLYGGSD